VSVRGRSGTGIRKFYPATWGELHLNITAQQYQPWSSFRQFCLSIQLGMNIDTLINEKCTACRRDSPLVTDSEMQELKPQIPDWMLVQREGIQRLERVFTVRDFAEALSFTNRIGALAEAEGHHPAILTEWGRVTVTLWTHKIHGLHRNDFIMAAKIDSLAPEP
jgi:4a-hydroxytetrahydrobiopterin dehydratase